MEPTYVDFAASPPLAGNAEVYTENCMQLDGHLRLDAGGSVQLWFTVPADEEIIEGTLTVTALVSKLGPKLGFAPLNIAVNDQWLTYRLTIPGGGDLPQANVFAVPGRWLRPGRNVLCVASAADASTMLWLYRITLDSVYDRGRSERALADAHLAEPVLCYDTRRSLDGTQWTPGPPVFVYVERGEQSLPAHLAWQDGHGGEYGVCFEGEMRGFYGHCREPGGEPHEFRGTLAHRWADPPASGVAPRRFDTSEGWGGGWHRSNGITFLVGDGSWPLRSITWRDQRGNCASIGLVPEGDRFFGYYQRLGEGPIGYRGQLGSGAEDDGGYRM